MAWSADVHWHASAIPPVAYSANLFSLGFRRSHSDNPGEACGSESVERDESKGARLSTIEIQYGYNNKVTVPRSVCYSLLARDLRMIASRC